jgi:hypothetical protein
MPISGKPAIGGPGAPGCEWPRILGLGGSYEAEAGARAGRRRPRTPAQRQAQPHNTVGLNLD